MRKILKTSAAFSLFFKTLIFLYPLCVFGFWFKAISGDALILSHQPNSIGIAFYPGPANVSELTNIPTYLHLYDSFIDIIPTAIVMLTFYYLHKLFQLYAMGVIFSKLNIIYLQKIGKTLLMQTIAGVFAQPFIGYVLKLATNTSGPLFSISFSKDDFLNLIIGCIVILISWVMYEARQLEDELALTV